MVKDVTTGQNSHAVMFLVFTRGDQFVSRGQITVRGNSGEAAKEELEAVLNSISAVERSEGGEGYRPVALPEKYMLTYYEQKTLKLADGIVLPVPDGFKGSTDQSLIGAPRRFSIVPEDYSDFSKAVDARIGITAVLMQGDIPVYSPAVREKTVDLFCEQLEENYIFVANTPRMTGRVTKEGIIFCQKAMRDVDSFEYLTAKIVLWAGSSGYVITFAVNLDDKTADRTDVGMAAQMIVCDWMSRIRLPGEKPDGTPSGPETEAGKAQIDNNPPERPGDPVPEEEPPEEEPEEDLPEVLELDSEGLAEIPADRYSGCKLAKKVIIPEGITKIGSSAFRDAVMKEAVLPASLKEIGPYAFCGCTRLKEITVREGLEEIGLAAFTLCPELACVDVPDSIRKISWLAFVGEISRGSSNIVVKISGRAAKKLYESNGGSPVSIIARRFEIGGGSYSSIEEYYTHALQAEIERIREANRTFGAGDGKE